MPRRETVQGGAILQRHPYEDLRVWQNAIGFLEMIYHETADFPPAEQQELGRRLRDAAIDWIYDLSVAHARPQVEFVTFLKSYHLYRTRLIILLKLGFRVGLIPAHAYGTLEGDLMEQEKVVAHQIELLESGRGMHTGALTSRSAARSAQVADRDRGGRSRDRDDRGRGGREERDDRGRGGREERDDRGRSSRAEPARREEPRDFGRRDDRPAREPADFGRPAPREERPAEARASRRVSSRELDEVQVPAPPAPREESAPVSSRGGRRVSSREVAPVEDETPVEAPVRARRASSRREDTPPPAAPVRRASSREDDLDDEELAPAAARAGAERTPVRRRRRTAVAEAVITPEPEEAPATSGRRRRA